MSRVPWAWTASAILRYRGMISSRHPWITEGNSQEWGLTAAAPITMRPYPPFARASWYRSSRSFGRLSSPAIPFT